MLKNSNILIKDVRLGSARIGVIYRGAERVYPGVTGVDSGSEYGSWSYSGATRTRNITLWTQYIYQNGTRSAKIYGPPDVATENATVSQQYSDWVYGINNATRSRTETPVYTFIDQVKYGTPEVQSENGVAAYGDWGYSDSIRTRTITYNYSDIQQSGGTQSENAAATDYGGWVYNWTVTGGSTRTRSVTYRWSDGATNVGTAQSETGGTRYLVAGSLAGSINAGGGGSITITTVSHDYWPNTSGAFIQQVAVSDVSASATNGFGASVSGSTITITRGANISTSVVTGNVDFSKSGFISASGTGNNPNVTQAVNSYNAVTEQDGYWNASCGANYYYVDYQKLRTRYDWASGHQTYDGWYNGVARSQRIEGQCGWVRAWSGWSRTGGFCGANGTSGYDCDGTYKVEYYQVVRYYQFPDGSGRTDTQYGTDGLASRTQTEGVCGYSSQKTISVELFSSMLPFNVVAELRMDEGSISPNQISGRGLFDMYTIKAPLGIQNLNARASVPDGNFGFITYNANARIDMNNPPESIILEFDKF